MNDLSEQLLQRLKDKVFERWDEIVDAAIDAAITKRDKYSRDWLSKYALPNLWKSPIAIDGEQLDQAAQEVARLTLAGAIPTEIAIKLLQSIKLATSADFGEDSPKFAILDRIDDE